MKRSPSRSASRFWNAAGRGALPEGRFDLRLPGGSTGDPGRRRHRLVGEQHRAAQGWSSSVPLRTATRNCWRSRMANGRAYLSWLHLLQDLKARGLKGRRWCLGLLEGSGGGAARRPHPAVLGTQDGQRPRQTVPARAPGRQTSAPRDVPFGGPTREDALAAYDRFLVLYEDRYPKACECLREDRDVMFTFYDFLAAHGVHLLHDQPDRIDLRHGAPSHAPDQGLWLTSYGLDDGFQTRHTGRKTLASSQQLPTHRRRHFRQRRAATQRGRITSATVTTIRSLPRPTSRHEQPASIHNN